MATVFVVIIIVVISFIALLWIAFTINWDSPEKVIPQKLGSEYPGWKVISVRQASKQEYNRSPYFRFFQRSLVAHPIYIAKMQKENNEMEFWVKANTIFYGVSSIEFEPKDRTIKSENIKK